MLRTSTFLVMALGVTAIASAATPAAALSSMEPHRVPAPGISSLEPHRVPAPGISSVGKAEMPIPKQTNRTSVGNIEEPLPKQPVVLPPHWPPHCEAGCWPKPPEPPHPEPHPGPVVIVTPPIEVPVVVSNGVSPRVTSGPSYASTAQRPAAASQPITPQCGAAGSIPALAAGIDQLLPTAQLSEADTSKVTELRQMIQVLSTDGKVSAARDVEEIAMNILGYQKVWLRCGLGTFDWEKQVASAADAVQQK